MSGKYLEILSHVERGTNIYCALKGSRLRVFFFWGEIELENTNLYFWNSEGYEAKFGWMCCSENNTQLACVYHESTSLRAQVTDCCPNTNPDTGSS